MGAVEGCIDDSERGKPITTFFFDPLDKSGNINGWVEMLL
jgi:hypothetical protein